MPINNVDFLKQFVDFYFIETGSFKGETIQLALDAGFKKIRSVELNEDNYNLCKERFKDNLNVELYFGESEILFWEMIKDINIPSVFFLDSHYSGYGGDYVTSKGRSFSSIVSELKTLSYHPIKNHTILIDDRRDFGTINMDYISESEILRLIRSINFNYTIYYETGSDALSIFKDDIIVARVN